MLVGWLSKLARARAAMQQRLIWEETHFARAWNWVTSQRRSVQRDDAWSFRKGWPGSPLRLWISPFWLVGLDLVDSWLYLLCTTNQARVLWCANQVRHKARMTMTSFVHRLTCWLTGQAFSTSSRICCWCLILLHQHYIPQNVHTYILTMGIYVQVQDM